MTESMVEKKNVSVSETARARVVAEYRYLPPKAAEILAGWLTLLEECDARWHERWYPAPETSTAIQVSRSFAHLRPEQQAAESRAWREEREVFIKGAVDLLANYRRPLIIARAPEGLIAALSPGEQDG